MPTTSPLPTLTFAKMTCGRCGGSGSYSYNTMHGSTCYGCGGAKRKLTPAAGKALAAVKAFKVEHFSVLAGDLKPGDRVEYDGKVRTVASVTADGTKGSSTTNGVTTHYDYVTLTFTKPYRTMFGPTSSVSTPVNTKLVRAVADDDWLKVVDFARTLKGVTVAEPGGVS